MDSNTVACIECNTVAGKNTVACIDSNLVAGKTQLLAWILTRCWEDSNTVVYMDFNTVAGTYFYIVAGLEAK
ncbi:hypothetical protein MAR_026642 [Mya arenaria]|uniref:Uncharacterized protein n=1 Tax=Mya arenaria TaxID=6604 RepID=A0ABY7EU51_MYAAR|nr:hypothetical protein MAR_026642 [Mya arenaria]